jgi:hypothetical protein
MLTRQSFYKIVLGLSLLVLAFSACAAQAEPALTDTGSQGGEFSGHDSLVEALEGAGASVEPGEEIVHEFFPVPARIIQVDGAQVQVFEFPDEAARQSAQETISPDGASIGTSMITWIEPPHFFASGRLIVLYLGSDAATLELLTSLLGEPIAG